MTRAASCTALLLMLAAWGTAPGRAQSVPPSPPPAASASGSHPDFSGTWTIDRAISVDPSQISLTPSAGSNRPQSQNRRGGFGGYGGFGRGGSRQGGRSQRPTLSADEQARIKALTDELKTASATLVISHHDPTFVVDDAQEHAQFFQTDGSAAENHAGGTTIPTTTHWDGDRIVTEYAISADLTLVYTYTIVKKTNQLVVRVNRKAGDNVRPFSPDVKLVYNRKS